MEGFSLSRTLCQCPDPTIVDSNRLSTGTRAAYAFPGFHGIIEEISGWQRASRGKKKGLEISGAPPRHFHPPGDRARRRVGSSHFGISPRFHRYGVSRDLCKMVRGSRGSFLGSLRGSTLYLARACEDRGVAGPSAPPPRVSFFFRRRHSSYLRSAPEGVGALVYLPIPSIYPSRTISTQLPAQQPLSSVAIRSCAPIFLRDDSRWKIAMESNARTTTLAVEFEGTPPLGIRVTILFGSEGVGINRHLRAG